MPAPDLEVDVTTVSPQTSTPATNSARGAAHRRLVEEHRAVLLERLLDYLRQPSVSATGEGFPEATHRAVREMELAGLTARVVDTPGRPAVVGHRDGPPGTPTVLVYGHYDVQPAGPRALWRSEPFEPVIRDGRVWARGAGDNKGQHLAHLQALRLLLERDGGHPCGVTVVLDGEEEVGSPNLAAVVARERAALACDVVVWSDGPVDESGRWRLLHGVRGILGVRLSVAGPDRALHSGNFGNVAPNPAWALVHALASMRAPDGRVLVEGFTDDVEPLPAADRAALERLPVDVAAALRDIGVDALDDGHDELSWFERLAAVPTLTIDGIVTGDLDRTIIPESATARIDVRLVAGQAPERVFERIVEHLRRHAPRVTATLELAVPPSRTPLDNPFTPALARAVEAVTGEPPVLVPALGGTLPDFVWTAVLGVPSIGLPMANVDEANHGPNENLEVDRYLDGVAIAMTALEELAALGRPTGEDAR
ncbi:M20/M25/M40 family metallo-hydrolase [Geodermatophilus sp. SYSU D00815]